MSGFMKGYFISRWQYATICHTSKWTLSRELYDWVYKEWINFSLNLIGHGLKRVSHGKNRSSELMVVKCFLFHKIENETLIC